MTKIKRIRIEVSTEITEKLTIRQKTSDKTFCEICRCSVQVFSRSQISKTLDIDINEFELLFIVNEIHFAGSSVLICCNSLANYLMKFANTQNK